MSKDYAESRAAILRNLDGVHYEVDPKRKVGFLWLDRPPLNVVTYRGRSQIAAIIESFGTDADVRVVVIRGKNSVYTSGGTRDSRSRGTHTRSFAKAVIIRRASQRSPRSVSPISVARSMSAA